MLRLTHARRVHKHACIDRRCVAITSVSETHKTFDSGSDTNRKSDIFHNGSGQIRQTGFRRYHRILQHLYISLAVSSLKSSCIDNFYRHTPSIAAKMAPKRTRAGLRDLPHALKMLRGHGVLNGIVCRRVAGEQTPAYYKAQGLRGDACRDVCTYLIHCEDAERQWYWNAMMFGGATPFQIEKIAAETQRQSQAMGIRHAKIRRTEGNEVMAIDAIGRLH